MSVPYEFVIANDITSDSLLRIVEDSLGLDDSRHPPDQSARNPSVVSRDAPGFSLIAYAMDEISAGILGEWLGFRPKVLIGFHLSHEVEWRDVYPRILHAVSAVLECLPDDAALIVNYDTGRLIRRSGRVTLSDEPTAFYPEALAEIRGPYEFGRVPIAGDAP